ncbi:polymorphic toxin-type HINT domain-containing protein [Cellulosimicrobium cellulans]|nr:polymorphic toxin-type HINT domain-containing protein [Cellulosimicrobium cellulans]
MAFLVSFSGVPGAWRASVAMLAGLTAVAVGSVGLPAAAQPVSAAEPPATQVPATSPEPERTVGGYLWAPDAVSAKAIARLEDEPVEVVGERTPFSSTYALPTGAMALQSAPGPVWVPQGEGDGTALEDWAQTDLALVVDEDGAVRPVAHIGDLEVSGGGEPDTTGLVELASVTDPETGVRSALSWSGALPEPRLEGRRAVYEDVAAGTDLVVEASTSGFRHYLVAEDAEAAVAAQELPLTYSADGATLAPTEDGGALEAVTGEGQVVSRTSEPLAWDAEADAELVAPVTQELVDDTTERAFAPLPELDVLMGESEGPDSEPAPQGSEPESSDSPVPDPLAESVQLVPTVDAVDESTVSVTLSGVEDMVADASTTYPLVIDPPMYLASHYLDLYVQSGTTRDTSADGEIRLGTFDGGATVARSLLKIPTAKLAGKQILTAQLELFNFHSYSCNARNWEIWHVADFTAAARWTAQPAWQTRQITTSATAGYSSSCNDAWTRTDVKNAVSWAAGRGDAYLSLGIRAQNESDSYGWKRFYSVDYGSYVPAVTGTYNSKPNVPGATGVSPKGSVVSGTTWTNTLTPTLTSTVSDPDGDKVRATFQVLNSAGTVLHQAEVTAASGAAVQYKVPAGVLAENTTYTARVAAYDGRVWNSTWSTSLKFAVDKTAPGAPVVSSTDYPADNEWHKDANQAGTFTFKMAAADSSVTGYKWGLDKAPTTLVAVAGGAAGTASIKPTTVGKHTVQVQTVDRAGNVSALVSKYTFHVGRAGLVTPEEGTRVVRRARLELGTNDTTLTHVKYQWRRGPDSTVVTDIAAGALSSADGAAWGEGWQPVPTVGDYLSWDASMTLGFEGGPIQVRAVLATSAAGAGATYTQWIGVTIDPSASGAGTTEIGPGSVNLLTGDHKLSVTDVEEFGISLVRTASSRDTDSGYQLQEDLVRPATEGTEFTNVRAAAGESGGYATVAMDSTRFHTGTQSIKITPGATGISNTYGSLVGDLGGGMRLGLRAGSTYRVSGWIYVPAATGLNPPSPLGNRLTLLWKSGGVYPHPTVTGALSDAATKVDTWQHLTFDATIPADATEAFIRLYNGQNAATGKPVYYDDISVRQITAPFGKEWATGTADAAAGTAYTKISMPYDDVAAVHLTGGSQIWFSTGDRTKWFPEPGAEDLKLVRTNANAWRLTEIDGTITDFARTKSTGDFAVQTTAPPVASGQARHVYSEMNGAQRLYRVIAPIEDGVDSWPTNTSACTTATPARGCEVMELGYAGSTTATATTPGAFIGQVSLVWVWVWDPALSAMKKVEVARYRYDTAGRLVEVEDPRITAAGAPALVTRYEYDTDGRLAKVTAPGEEPYTFTYGAGGASKTGAGDFVDPSLGRLLKVSRVSLVPGTKDQLGPVNTSTVVYDVPLTRAKGGPYDLSSASLATWAQSDGPTDATAVFGPQDVPSVTTATATTPGADGYKPATVHYLNAAGLEVNTATPAGKNAPVEGFIDTAEYDRTGKTIRTLDATNRLLALRKLPNAEQMLTEWGLQERTSIDLATLFDSRSVYSADGLEVVSETGPAQQLALANDPNDIRLLRPHTDYVYDEGKPDGAAYHLVTTETTTGLDPDTGDKLDPISTKTTYSPVDGASALGATSGWVHKNATSITVDAGQPTALTSTVVYDDKGRAIKSSKPGSNGADAATTRTIFYTAGQAASAASCRDKPEWAGQPCVTMAAGPATGHDPNRMRAELPLKRNNAYNQFGSPTVVTENVGTDTDRVLRTTTTTYDAADRVTAVEITGNGAAAGLPIAKTTTTYDPTTGDVVKNASVNAAGTETAAVTKEYDRLGRLIKYTDAHGGWTKSVYDRYGQPTQVTDSIGTTRSYTYDRAIDPRGYVTRITDSVAGEITASWGPDGQLESQTLPGGVTLTLGYDTARVPVSRTYTRTADETVIAQDSVVENHRGQWITHTTPGGVRNYSYDRLGRLTQVDDVSAATETCTTRSYAYDTHTNRTATTTATGDETGTCPGTTGAATVTSTYDSADRLVTSSGPGGGSWSYDAFGRTTAMPTADGAATASTSYFLNDLVATQEVPQTKRTEWGLDPLMRFSTQDDYAWVDGAWANSVEKITHYDGDGDEPAWIVEDATLPDNLTRYVEGMDGNLAVETGKTGERVLQLVDLHGDITATLPIADGATEASWTETRFTSFDEFGNPQPMTSGETGNAPPARYGWLGAAQRNADTPTGAILMGVRLYHPATGRFLQTDQVAGGSASAYDYCNADPVNCTDLAGTFSWKGLVKTVAVVGEVASWIPGPVGAAAAGVSAVAYAASGNKGKALEMGVTAAANLVGAGAGVRAGFKVASLSAKAGARSVRPGIKAARASRPPRCSFIEGTLVRMADGSLRPIESLEPGDEILAADPESGTTQAARVLIPLEDRGWKNLIEIRLEGAADSIVATENHPFWVEGHGWVDAANLRSGDSLKNSTGTLVSIASVRDLGWFPGIDVYNLHVDGDHTYFVGSGDASLDQLVHNAGEACDLVSFNGPHAREGVALVNGKLTATVRRLINQYGNRNGCHTCGTRSPGTRSGNWIPDHQPSSALVPRGTPQTAYPHCRSCASRQGGIVSAIVRAARGGLSRFAV